MSTGPAHQQYDTEQLRRACRAHGLAGTQVVPLPQAGISNVLYLVDGRYCLRLPGPQDWMRWSIHVEASGVPLAAKAGLSVPTLVASDLSLQLVDAPFVIYEWMTGRPLSDVPTHDPAVRPVFTALGRDLARLHSLGTVPGLPPRPVIDPWPLLEQCATAGVLNPTNASWFATALETLESAGGAWAGPQVTVHGDTHPGNVLMAEFPGPDGSYAYRALLDWGDMSLADPRSDLVDVPLRAVPAVLEGYQQETTIDDLDSWRAGILWSQLDGALRYLTNPPSHVPHWGFPPGGRVFELVAFFSSELAEGWPRLSPPS
jgi:aminoglycoside phosphotransferase (APT) family kinase protein